MIFTQRLIPDTSGHVVPDNAREMIELVDLAFIATPLPELAGRLGAIAQRSSDDQLGPCWLVEFASETGDRVVFTDYDHSPVRGTSISLGSRDPVDYHRTLPKLLEYFAIPPSSVTWSRPAPRNGAEFTDL